ncbi:MAG: ABC transporter permease [Candidatus Hodarchaeota archaeon]
MHYRHHEKLEKVLETFKEDGEKRRYKDVSFREKTLVLLEKGFKTFWSYKGWIALDIIGTVVIVALYYYVSFIVSASEVEKAGYGADFFTFALIGIAFQQYTYSSIQVFSHEIRYEQENGTLEAVLSTRTEFPTFLIGVALLSFIYATYFLICSFLVAFIFFDPFITTNIFSLLSVLVLIFLSILAHICIGITSVGIIMKIKEGDPLLWLFGWLTLLLSGIYYPLDLLPLYLIPIALLLPLTYALDGIRLCLIDLPSGSETLLSPQVFNDVLALLIFIIIMLPLSLKVFRWGFDEARKEGTLHTY